MAHAPSNVKDAAAGKSFIFINIVARSAVMGTLLRAANTRVCRVRTVENAWSQMDEYKVGRTPWSAADAHVGLLLVFVSA